MVNMLSGGENRRYAKVNRKLMRNKHKENMMYHVKEERLGSITGIQTEDGRFARAGDIVCFKGKKHYYTGILLYNKKRKCFGICSYLEKIGADKYDANSYMYFMEIPTDNGAKMNVEILEEYVTLRQRT